MYGSFAKFKDDKSALIVWYSPSIINEARMSTDENEFVWPGIFDVLGKILELNELWSLKMYNSLLVVDMVSRIG